MTKKSYTPTEVGTLVESFDQKLSLIAEHIVSMDSKLRNVEQDVSILTKDVQFTKDVIKTSIPELYQRVSKLEFKTSL